MALGKLMILILYYHVFLRQRASRFVVSPTTLGIVFLQLCASFQYPSSLKQGKLFDLTSKQANIQHYRSNKKAVPFAGSCFLIKEIITKPWWRWFVLFRPEISRSRKPVWRALTVTPSSQTPYSKLHLEISPSLSNAHCCPPPTYSKMRHLPV